MDKVSFFKTRINFQKSGRNK